MLSGMFTKAERRDFSVSVRSKGKPPNPWRWEIHRAGRLSAVEQSLECFSDNGGSQQGGQRSARTAIEETFN